MTERQGRNRKRRRLTSREWNESIEPWGGIGQRGATLKKVEAYVPVRCATKCAIAVVLARSMCLAFPRGIHFRARHKTT
jgi:hypothetical protein